jgi:hypothetical protein
MARIRSPRAGLDTLHLNRIDAWQATAESARVQIFEIVRESRHKALCIADIDTSLAPSCCSNIYRRLDCLRLSGDYLLDLAFRG